MSTKRAPRAVTVEEMQTALTILLRAASDSGVTPGYKLSANRVLSENGVSRPSYMIQLLTRSGIIERIPRSWQYQLLRGTLERNTDTLSLPQQIADTKRAEGAINHDSGTPEGNDLAWYQSEVKALLELNERLTREHDERDEHEAGLESELRELRQENEALKATQRKQADELVVAANLVDDYNERGTKIGKLEYDNKKLAKSVADLTKRLGSEQTHRRTAEDEARRQSQRAERLQRELLEHSECIGGEAAEHIRSALHLLSGNVPLAVAAS